MQTLREKYAASPPWGSDLTLERVTAVTASIFASSWPDRTFKQFPPQVLRPLASWQNTARKDLKAEAKGTLTTADNAKTAQTEITYFMQNAEPFVFYNPDANRTAIICLNEKTGSTTWKLALTKALTRVNGGNNKTGASFQKFNRGVWPVPASRNPHIRTMWKLPTKWQMLGGYPALEEALRSPNVPRFMFVRNPYVRLLSGFADKIEHAITGGKLGFMSPKGYSVQKHLGLGLEANFSTLKFPLTKDQFVSDGFPDFVEAVSHLSNARYQLNGHFTPQSVHCGIKSGLEFDYYLPVEEMDQW